MERAAGRTAVVQPVHAPRVPARAACVRQRERRDRLAGAVPVAAPKRRDRRRLPALPEGAFVRRVRVRLGLGRRLPAAPVALLPEAARCGAVHAGSRSAPARKIPGRSPVAASGDAAVRARGQAVVGAPALSRRGRPGGSTGERLDDAQHGAVSLDQPRAVALRRLRGLPRQPAARQAQEDPAGAPTGRAKPASRSRRGSAPRSPRPTGISSTAAMH